MRGTQGRQSQIYRNESRRAVDDDCGSLRAQGLHRCSSGIDIVMINAARFIIRWAHALADFLVPAMQHIGIGAVFACQCCNRYTRSLANVFQMRFWL